VTTASSLESSSESPQQNSECRPHERTRNVISVESERLCSDKIPVPPLTFGLGYALVFSVHPKLMVGIVDTMEDRAARPIFDC
jgi:hypothetical protein